MENNRFDKQAKNLIIGDFVIDCWKESSGICGELPFSGMAFYHPGEKKADFQFMIDTVEPDNSGELLFGSEFFSTPTFLYQGDSGWYDWKTLQDRGTKALSFRISPNWSKFILYEDETDTRGERAFWEFGHLFAYAVLNHNACVLHGVVMEYQGKGILVLASSGTGKTTHTRMWRDSENALIINGDRCLCRKTEGKWYAYGMPWSGSSGEYINRKVEISAIVALERGSENTVETMSAYDSVLYLMQRVFIPHWPGAMQEKAFDMAQELAETIPVLKLRCLPNLEAVQTLKTAILNLE